MKNLFCLFIGLATALLNINAQVTLQLDPIESVGLGINGTITLSQGSSQKITVTGPTDLVDDLDTNVKDGSWNISYLTRSKNEVDEELQIDIQVKSIHNVAVSGKGKIITKGKFDSVSKRNIAVSGKGSIKFKGDSENLSIALSGNGYIEFDGDSDYMSSALSGAGDIILSGSADYINMAASGGGSMGSTDLKVKECKAAISGTTILTAEVEDRLDLIVSGNGVFRYKGNPKIVKKSDSKNYLQKI